MIFKQLCTGKFGYDRWEGPFEADQPNGAGVMNYVGGSAGPFEFENGKPLSKEEDEFDGPVSDFNDGSPSTVGVAGHYNGGWSNGLPHGFGVMNWENGIEYKGTQRGYLSERLYFAI